MVLWVNVASLCSFVDVEERVHLFVGADEIERHANRSLLVLEAADS